jgi:hypothetical protein
MHKMQPNHQILLLPNIKFSKEAEDKSKFMFKRVLSNWAQDLLVYLQNDKIGSRYNRAA